MWRYVRRSVVWLTLILAISIGAVIVAQQQQPPIGIPHVSLGDGPFIFDTAEQHKIRVVVVTKGLSHPWSLAFLPDGGMLVTERAGRLRAIRDGILDPQPLAGIPKVHAFRNAGLFDIALHPKFTENKLVYFTYSKPGENGQLATTLARGRLDRGGLTDVHDPFVGRPGYKPEIYSLGHRDQLGLAIQPETGAVLSNENGPNGGDEINLILPGRNYGWPVVSYGRTYEGPRVSETPWREGFEQPLVVWIPSIALSGMTFYTGNRFPNWKGNIFVGGMRQGEIPITGRLDRIVFNDKMEELRRESLLIDLKQRIRDVRQGPDGLLYLLTEEEDGAVLRIEP